MAELKTVDREVKTLVKEYTLTLNEREMLVVGALCSMVRTDGQTADTNFCSMSHDLWRQVYNKLIVNGNYYFHRQFFREDQDIVLSKDADVHLNELLKNKPR